MERVEETAVRDQIQQANAELADILSGVRGTLAGRGRFAATDIRTLSKTLSAMDRIVSRAAELRAVEKDLDSELKKYELNLQELQISLDQVRFMLLAQQSHVVAAQDKLERINLWTEALKQTQ